MRGFILGIGIGIVIGVSVAPMITSLDRSSAPASLDRWASSLFDTRDLDRERWPSGQQVLVSVFKHQGWDDATAASSSATISTCISVDDDISCQFDLNLAWLNQTRSVEALFEENAGEWLIVTLKAR